MQAHARKGRQQGESLRTVATVRVADGKGQTVGRDRANAEWRFFRDGQECRNGATWSYHAATFFAAASRRLPSYRVGGMRRAAMAVRVGDERQPESRGFRHAKDIFRQSIRQRRQNKTGEPAPITFPTANCHQSAFFIPWHAGPAFGAQRAGGPQPARRADRSGEQGAGEDMAIPSGAVRARCVVLSRCSNPRISHPKLRGDRL